MNKREEKREMKRLNDVSNANRPEGYHTPARKHDGHCAITCGNANFCTCADTLDRDIGYPKFINDPDIIKSVTGDSDADREGYKGLMLYDGNYWINVLDDGEFELHIERSIYIDSNLSKLETILRTWVASETNGGK